jgi:GT2 family glycosyltransferase/SAM-dependent methyltransferase
MTPAVSVVIPCFDLGAFLDEAVQSVLAQTFQDFEILIVDDGSEDTVTKHLLASYKRPHTRIIRTENRGVASARNTGLEQARGRHVSFLDADDMYEPRFLESTVARLEADESLSFASCWLTAFGVRQFTWEPERCDLPWLLAEDTVCTAAPTRREALLAVGGFDESPSLDGYEDWALAISLLESGFSGEIVRERLFRYRIRQQSKTTLRTAPQNHMRVFERLVNKHADSYRVNAPGVLAAIGDRIALLEPMLPGDPPPRPRLGPHQWRGSILALESHRRELEQTLAQPSQEPDAGAGQSRDEDSHGRPRGGQGQDRQHVEWGSLRQVEPVSRVWGLDRGQPIDRHYIEAFLGAHAEDITGDVLEVKDAHYTERFQQSVRSVTVLDVAEQNEQATLIADLSCPEALPEEGYDSIVLTQTLQFLFDVEAAVANIHRALAPGGVVLATVPSVSRVDYESGVDGDFWRLTAASAQRLFEASFGADGVEVEAFGNVLSCTAFLQGLASDELAQAELDRHDPYFPLVIAIRAVKREGKHAVERRRPTIEGGLDEASCGWLSGWAWNPAAPGQRLRLEAWSGEELVGSVWSDQFREDLAEIGKSNGRVAFRFVPERPLHGDPPPDVRVVPAGSGDPLPGSPRTVECLCEQATFVPAPGLVGAALDAPDSSRALSFPWMEVVGWAVGERAACQRVELSHAGKPFQSVPLDGHRADIADLFPDRDWAGRAGFATRVSMVATSGAVEIDVEAVLSNDERVSIGQITGSAPGAPATPVTVMLDEQGRGADAGTAVLRQDTPASRVLVRSQAGLLGHPCFAVTHGWGRTLDEQEGLVWLSDGHDAVTDSFLGAAIAALEARPRAAFAVAVAEHAGSVDFSLVRALSGAGLGAAMLFRASALRAVGGIDEGAPDALQAQWDLGIRLAEVGYQPVEVLAMKASGQTICGRAGDETARALYRKHSELYDRHLRAVLLDREHTIGDLLRENHLAERVLEEELRPRLRARRRERNRLGAKLRRSRPEVADAPERGSDPWGELRRFEPLSPFSGGERGLCVDRYYIERFLEGHAEDIHGRVLEYHDAVYASRYGGDRLAVCDIIDADPTNQAADVLADLHSAPQLPASSYDCIILPHFLQLTDDPSSALGECARLLKPGGVLLASAPSAAKIEAVMPSTDYWRFSAEGLAGLLADHFSRTDVEVQGHGSSDALAAFLVGLAAEEVGSERLEGTDPDRPLVITARAVKPIERSGGRSLGAPAMAGARGDS